MQGETTLTFAADHPAFAGHFPGRPMVPGVLLLDAALHAVAQAREAAGDTAAAGQPVSCQIAAAKFLSPVLPGETLTISWTRSDKGPTRFEIAGKGRQVATGSLVFATAA
jgi:3-hydroxyacyl-[acyl-carrier-protein] dehydratase